MDSRLPRLGLAAALLATLAALTPVLAQDGAQVRPHAGMMRTPDVSATHIVFAYANDLWLVPREGGVATPLASPPGAESFPRFSPDGKHIAFRGNYDGGSDLYTIPVEGGIPTRVTHHPAGEALCDWTADGRLLFFAGGIQGLGRQTHLFTVAPGGGLPEALPVPYGAFAAIDATGTWLAYTPHTRDHRTWKRYQGGMATDIWLFNLEDHSSRRVTDWPGTDSQPMWHGERLYYVSDAGPEHRINIWTFDPDSGAQRQITDFAEHDVRYPAMGPGPGGAGEIVFQVGAQLRLLDLATEASRSVEVIVPGARPTLRPVRTDASQNLGASRPSPTGKRVVVEARGDIWTLPAEHGVPRNLTGTSGVAERDPAWSPDGRWIAYFSDASGEYELYLHQSDGRGEPRRVTQDGAAFRADPSWSPDSKRLTFSDKTGRLFLVEVESGAVRQVDQDPSGRPMSVSWSHDSNWLAYARALQPRRQSSIWLHDIAAGSSHQVTSGAFSDSLPTFDRKGDHLFFASSRSFSPAYGELDTSFIYANTEVLLAVPLRADMPSPFAPKIDEETFGDSDEKKDEDKQKENGKDEGKDESSDEASGEAGEESGEAADEPADGEGDQGKSDAKKKEPLRIDLEGFERRAVQIPVKPGVFRGLGVTKGGKLVYLRGTGRGFPGETSLVLFDLADDKREEKQVASPVNSFQLSADGEQILVRSRGKLAFHEPKADSKAKAVSTDEMHALIAPRAEWRQIARDAWRLQRDFFYDEGMHGVDWDAVWTQYEAMLPDCVTREDVGHVIREMISELNVGHAYYRPGGEEQGPRVSVGLLGCDFELAEGAYRIARIIEGAVWDFDARGPLSQPGIGVAAGDWLLAVEGRPLDPARDPWAAFQGLADKTVTLTVSSKPVLDDEARQVVVKCLSSEGDLRYRAWVEERRARVAEASEGRVGYVHVPDTGVNGQNELVRQFYGQLDTDALIVDDRWNGGGQIPTRFVELLNRPVTNYWAVRDGADWVWPPDSHQGPKCMLINGLAGSGGDAFPAYFRQRELGSLIGTRTWGGLVGISGNPGLIDGAGVTVPTFGYYTPEGVWSIEGYGVAPDIEVLDDPAQMVGGVDVQLEAAILHMLDELERAPYRPPSRPSGPDRRGMGIDPAHR